MSQVDYTVVLQDLKTRKTQIEAAISVIEGFATVSAPRDNPFAGASAQVNGVKRNGKHSHNGSVTMGFGKNAETPLNQMAVSDLMYYQNWLANVAPTKESRSAKMRASDKSRLEAVVAELATRPGKE
jgi:hypothetical protein